MAILDIHDLGLAREKGRDLVGVMALVQRPLAAVLAQPGIRTPKDLEGKRAGVTGLPSDDAVLRSVVAGRRRRPRPRAQTTIGFEAVKALLAGRVAGATAFWNVEGVALQAKRPGMREFRVDDYGAPAYPELVLCVTRETLRGRRRRWCAPRSARSSAATRGPERPGERRLGDARRASRASTAPRSPPSSTPSRPAFTAGAAEFGQLRPVGAAGVGGVGRAVRDPEGADRRARARSTRRSSGRRPTPDALDRRGLDHAEDRADAADQQALRPRSRPHTPAELRRRATVVAG